MAFSLSLYLWLLGIIGIIVSHLKPELPFMQYSLLAIIHILFIGGIMLPIVMNSSIGPVKKISFTFIISGLFVLIYGFASSPRTALPMDGGIFICIGVLLSTFKHFSTPLANTFWPSVALVQTCLLGCILGNTLDRVSLDPIPFSLLTAHALSGIFLALTPLVLFSMNRDLRDNHPWINFSLIALGLSCSTYLSLSPYPLVLPIRILLLSTGVGLGIFLFNSKKFLSVAIISILFLMIFFKLGGLTEGGGVELIFLGWALGLILFLYIKDLKGWGLFAFTGFLFTLFGLFRLHEKWIQVGSYIQAGSILMTLFTRSRPFPKNTSPPKIIP